MPLVRASIAQQPKHVPAATKCPEATYRCAEKRRMSQIPTNVANRSSSISYGSELKFKAVIKLTKSDGNGVCFKQDGHRFEAEETLKLQSSFNYTVKIEVTPVLELLYFKMVGIDYAFELINDPENDSTSVYQFTWSTQGIEPTLNRHRSDVPCSMKFKNYKEIDFKLQVKFYHPTADSKHTWGQTLNNITMECIAGRGTYLSKAGDRFITTYSCLWPRKGTQLFSDTNLKMYKLTSTKKLSKTKRACILKIDIDEETTDKTVITRNIKRELELFGRPMETIWKKVGAPAERFINLLTKAKANGDDVEKLVEPRRFNDTMFSFLYSGIRGQYREMSNIFCGVYKSTFLSKEYHRYMYMNEAFWEPLMDHGVLLQLPDIQFFEGVMAYVSVIAQISYADTCSGSPHQLPVVEEEYFFVTTYSKAPVIYKTFKRLLELQEKGFSSSKTKLKIDYERIASGYFDKRVQQDFWTHTTNYPVDFICMLMFCFIRLPPIQEALFMDTASMEVLMDILRSKSCENMHTMLMFILENLVVNSRIMSAKLFNQIMKTLNFKLILSFAMKQNFCKDLLRRSAQKVIIDTICYRDECKLKNTECYFPSRKTLTAVELDQLKEFISVGNMADRGFAYVLIGEMIEKEEMRDVVIQQDVPKLCVRSLREMIFSNPSSEYNLRIIEGSLTVLMRLAHANKDRQEELLKVSAVDVAVRYMFCEDEKIRYVAKSALLNLSGRVLDAQLQLFKNLNFKELVSDSRDYHVKYVSGNEKKESYLKMMHVNIALIRQELTVNHHLTKGNGIDNSYIHMNGESSDKLMEIISYCIMDNKKTLTPTFILLSVASLTYLLIMEKVDVKKWLTSELIATILNVYTDKSNVSFLKSSPNFQEQMEKRYPKLMSKSDGEEKVSSLDDNENSNGVKCSWPPCLNYGPSKETKDMGLVRKPLKRCSNCYVVAYCGITCQRSHWKEHKKDCKKPS